MSLLKEMENRIREISTPRLWVPLLLSKNSNSYQKGVTCALTWRMQIGAEAMNELVQDAYATAENEVVKDKNCKDYFESHANCTVSCFDLLGIKEGQPPRIRLVTVLPEMGKNPVPYRVSMENGAFKFELLKIPANARKGCLSDWSKRRTEALCFPFPQL